MGAVKADAWDFPRTDELLLVIKYPASVAQGAARACDIDVNPGMISQAYVEELRNPPYSWSVTASPGFHMCYIGINCRGHTPESSGAYQNYHGRTPGFSLYPLEIAQFRYALELIVGCEKDVWINDIYGYINVRLDTYVPPANVFWFNPTITPYPEDWDLAAEMLHSAGFTGTIQGNDWVMPNLVPLNDREGNPVTHEKAIYVMSPDSAPTSMEITRRHVKKWNLFFDNLEVADGAHAAIFKHEPTDFYVEIDVAFLNRDFDLFMLCWGLTRNPTYVYYTLHPETDIIDGSNAAGLDYRPLNIMVKSWYDNMYYEYFERQWIGPGPMTVAALTTKNTAKVFVAGTEELWIGVDHAGPDYPWYYDELEAGTDYEVVVDSHGKGVRIRFLDDIFIPEDYYIHIVYQLDVPEPITSMAVLQQLMFDIQDILYYACPYLPIYSRNYHDLYKPGLTCWVPSLGYGSATYQLKWTYASLHWTGVEVGGSIKWCNPGPVNVLHPWISRSVYEVTILNRIYDGMIEVDAYTHKDIPYLISNYKMIDWTGPSGEPGMIIQFWIRPDIWWQDGDCATVDDFIWQYDFINSVQPAAYYGLWSTYHGCIRYNDYCFGVKVNGTGIWKFYDYVLGLVFPKKVWNQFWGNRVAAEAFRPATVSYDSVVPPELRGPRSPPTALYGTGEWIFDYHNVLLGISRLYKDLNGWARYVATPCRQIPSIHAPTEAKKTKILTFTNTTTVPLGPGKKVNCTYWHCELPALLFSSVWHCWSHIDDDNNGLDAGDKMCLHCVDPPWLYSNRLNIVVTSVTVVGDVVTITTTLTEPKITKTVIGLDTFNLDTKHDCEHTWTLYMDGVQIATGVRTLTPLQYVHWWQPLSWQSLVHGNHVFTLRTTNVYGTNSVCMLMSVLIGDVNDDNIVNMLDLFKTALKFGWTGAACQVPEDVNNDGIVSMLDLFICAVKFGTSV